MLLPARTGEVERQPDRPRPAGRIPSARISTVATCSTGCWKGARISLLVGFAGALISFFVGTAYGLVAGYAGGRTDAAMMRAVEILYSIPRLIIILIFINAFDNHLKNWWPVRGWQGWWRTPASSSSFFAWG